MSTSAQMLNRTVVVGLGIQGNKRAKFAGPECVATVDPFNAKAQFKKIQDVPLDSFDSALVCTPDDAKFEILEYLLKNRKHVLVEKPILAPDNKQIEHLLMLSRELKTTCYTAYNHRFEPHIASLKKVLDSGQIGNVYLAKIFYGNGTARDVRNSPWRDKGMGVLPDLGSHLLDMVLFLLGKPQGEFEPWSFNCFENKSFDHFIFAKTGRPVVELEATLLSWRNTFTLDLYGELGSAHIFCLCKWGPSTLTVRKRVLPSGRPQETTETLECADPTWAIEYDYFKELCKTGGNNLENDMWINSILNQIGSSVMRS